MNAATAKGRIKNRNARTVSQTAVIAARTFGILNSVLRTIVNRVRISRSRRRWNRRVKRSAAERFVIRASRIISGGDRRPRIAIVIGKCGGARTHSQLESKNPARCLWRARAEAELRGGEMLV